MNMAMNPEPRARGWESAASDEELVQRIVAGDATLFEILMRRHNQRVYRTVRAVLRAEDDVDDVMQQAWLAAWAHLGQFAGAARFSTWLTRIAVNEALGRRRRNAAGPVSGGETMTLALVDEKTPDPEREAAASQLREAMEQEISALPDAFRAVFMLREVEGLDTAETAAVLGISEDLVKTRLHRGKALLRENLFNRAGVTLRSAFAFGNEHCDRLVAAVMARLS